MSTQNVINMLTTLRVINEVTAGTKIDYPEIIQRGLSVSTLYLTA